MFLVSCLNHCVSFMLGSILVVLLEIAKVVRLAAGGEVGESVAVVPLGLAGAGDVMDVGSKGDWVTGGLAVLAAVEGAGLESEGLGVVPAALSISIRAFSGKRLESLGVSRLAEVGVDGLSLLVLAAGTLGEVLAVVFLGGGRWLGLPGFVLASLAPLPPRPAPLPCPRLLRLLLLLPLLEALEELLPFCLLVLAALDLLLGLLGIVG